MEEKFYELADLYKVFGDTTRIKILYVLKEGELCVCDIAQSLSMTVSAVSHQLKVLKNARLVKARKEGKSVFYSLDDDHVFKIIDKFIYELNERLQAQHLTLTLTQKAKEYLASEGFEKMYGARPLKRFIQKHIETNLAKEILKGHVSGHQEIVVDYENNEIIFKA